MLTLLKERDQFRIYKVWWNVEYNLVYAHILYIWKEAIRLRVTLCCYMLNLIPHCLWQNQLQSIACNLLIQTVLQNQGNHDDVNKWNHFALYGPFVRGIHRPPMTSPHRPVTRSLMFSVICARINVWVNNGEAGDLRRHRAHYDVTMVVMIAVVAYVRVLINVKLPNVIYIRYAGCTIYLQCNNRLHDKIRLNSLSWILKIFITSLIHVNVKPLYYPGRLLLTQARLTIGIGEFWISINNYIHTNLN